MYVSHLSPSTINSVASVQPLVTWSGANDVGDISGVAVWCGIHCIDEPLTVEVKSYANLATGVRVGLDQLDAEMANAGTCHGVLVVKPKGKGLTSQGDWLAIRRVRNDSQLSGTT